MLPQEQPDRIHAAFDDHRLVANAGLLLPVTLALRLGFGELVDRHVDLGPVVFAAPLAAVPENKRTAHATAPVHYSIPSGDDASPAYLAVTGA